MRSSQVLVHWGQTTGLFFDFDSNDQVSVLCDQIQSRIGLPAHVQRLVCEGRVLNPSHTFAGYGIQHAANISIALDLKGGMPWNKGMFKFFCDNGCGGEEGGGRGWRGDRANNARLCVRNVPNPIESTLRTQTMIS